MADRDHLPLTRVQRPPSRRRKRRSGWRPPRQYGDFAGHAADLDSAAAQSVEDYGQRREQVEGFDPKLILRFALNRRVTDAEWRRAGLMLLDSSDTDAVVVFADDDNLNRFRERLRAYSEGPGEPQPREDGEGETEPTAPHEGFFDAIDDFGFTEPPDRITPRLGAALSEDPSVDRIFDVEYWFVSSEARLEEWMTEAAERAAEFGADLLDEYVGAAAGVALARIRGTGDAISAISKLDQVASIDLVPTAAFERSELFDLQDIERIEVGEPDPSAPVVGIVDSGVQAGHPLLEPAIADAVALHPEFDDQAEDTAGHGTLVAGIALYGDVLAAARAGNFEPGFWLASVRVLDDDARFPESVNWVKAISEAITYLAESWQVRVINLSIGNAESPYGGGKSTALAAELDTLVRRHRLLLVISAGNLPAADADHENWPEYLLSPDGNGNLLDPAQTSAAFTVGATSGTDGLTDRGSGTNLDAVAVSPAFGPAPFTRSGPGVRGAIKPEFSAEGGNYRYDLNSRGLHPDPAIEVISTSARYPDRLFETTTGTSFAAPSISNVAGRLAARYPGYDANAIRAMMLQGAAHLEQTETHFESFEDPEAAGRALCGFGALEWERCGHSDDNRVVMVAEDALLPDDFHVYRVPMTEQFTDVSGPHEIAIGLAFSPRVRNRRYDYLAYQMEFQLVRGWDLGRVFDLAGTEFEPVDGERASPTTSPRCGQPVLSATGAPTRWLAIRAGSVLASGSTVIGTSSSGASTNGCRLTPTPSRMRSRSPSRWSVPPTFMRNSRSALPRSSRRRRAFEFELDFAASSCTDTLRLFFNRARTAQLRRDAQVKALLSFRVDEKNGKQYAYVIFRGAGGKVRFIAMANDDGEWRVNVAEPAEFPGVS